MVRPIHPFVLWKDRYGHYQQQQQHPTLNATMKFALACTALTLATSTAFVPLSLQATTMSAAASRTTTSMSAVSEATSLYTFAKSEKIFAEAQTVRRVSHFTTASAYGMKCAVIIFCRLISLTNTYCTVLCN
jgi:hypothetical protein